MQVPIVRFSRPLLLMTDRNQYKTIYGFVFQDKDWQEDIYTVIKFYVGYLCGVADFTNGGDEFSVSFDLKGILNWVDDRGVLHQGTDAWMKEIGSRCMKKLNLNCIRSLSSMSSLRLRPVITKISTDGIQFKDMASEER